MRCLGFKLLSLVSLGLFSSACMEQYNPEPHRAKIEDQRLISNRIANRPELTSAGTLPLAEGEGDAVADGSAIVGKYQSFCSSCHGADGAANSELAAAMDPAPRNLTDKDWQASVTDEHLVKLLKEGGAGVGLAPTMPPWQGVLSDEEIVEMVGVIRAFGS